jgi:hypothetical protein
VSALSSCVIDLFVKQPTLRRPCSLRRRVRRRPFSFPSNTRGWRAQKARQVVNCASSFWEDAAPFGAPSRRLTLLRAALLATACFGDPPSASSWQEVLVPPGGAPSPPGSLGGAFVSRPRAPHPCSTIKTPHDSALVEQDARNVRAPESVGITYFRCWELFQAAVFLALVPTKRREVGRHSKS